eukprot:1155398-Pleurochrysis_carterae.AAC.1
MRATRGGATAAATAEGDAATAGAMSGRRTARRRTLSPTSSSRRRWEDAVGGSAPWRPSTAWGVPRNPTRRSATTRARRCTFLAT